MHRCASEGVFLHLKRYTVGMEKATIMQVNGLTKRYGTALAVDDVTFTITQGEVVGFVGLNGAGKSTTINALLGFIRPTRGTIELFDQKVFPQTAHATHQHVGFASGDMALFGHLTGAQYLTFLSRRYATDTKPRTDELCARFKPQLRKKISSLSRGNKQKIALVAAFMASPELVVLDEPTSGLDPFMQEAFLDLVREEAQRGTTIFMSSHYLNEVADVCSRVLLMRKGTVVKDIQAKQLLAASGKSIRLVTHHQVTPPRNAELVVNAQANEGYELSFIYKDTPAKLHQWFSGVPGVIDFVITEYDVEAAFSEVYAHDAGGSDA